MKKVLLPLIALCAVQAGWSQVGINNTTPQSTLDITASNVASPASTDGILIPRVDDFPATDPGAAQDGMMVFATGNGTPAKGFYYWDNAGAGTWLPIAAGGDTDWIDNGSDIERQSGDVYIGDTNGTDNDLYISDRIADWDDTNFYLDPNANSAVDEINFSAGSETDPSITFDVDTNSGFYRPATDAIGISTNGSERFRFTEQGQLEFYNTGNSVFLGEFAGRNDDLNNRQNVAIGYRALRDNVSGARNIAIGSGALLVSTGGTANVAIGDDAMAASTSGSSDIALGIQALFRNTTGNNNTALGGTAMRENTTGSNNTAIGFRSLYNNIATNGNVALGFDAGFTNTAGVNNTYLGTNAGHINLGSRNVFVGNSAGYNEPGSDKLYIENSNSSTPLIYGEFDTNILRTNGTLQINDPSTSGYAFPSGDGTTGQILVSDGSGAVTWTTTTDIDSINNLTDGKSDNDGTQDGSSVFLGVDAGAGDDSSDNHNVGVGFEALENNILGTNNTALGYQTLQDNSAGGQNTAIGYQALLNNTDGGANTAVGSVSLDANTTGIWNTAVGQASLGANADGAFNTAVGRAALTNNINGNSNVAMGVNALGVNSTGSFNTVLGVDAANASTDGSSNTVIGRRAMNSHSAGSNNVALGASAGYYGDGIQNTYLGTTAGFSPSAPTRDGSVFIGYGAGSTELTSNKLYIENSAADSDNALIYGEFDNNVVRVNGAIQVSNPTGTGYALPTADGTANQVLITDGSGQISWADAGSGTPSLVRTYLSSTQMLVVGSQKLLFDTVLFDTKNEFDTANNRFVASTTGYYRVNAQIYAFNASGTPSASIRVFVNGNLYQQVFITPTGSNLFRNTDCLVFLNVNDYVEIFSSSGSTTTNVSSSNTLTFFEIQQIN